MFVLERWSARTAMKSRVTLALQSFKESVRKGFKFVQEASGDPVREKFFPKKRKLAMR